jgi:hypothetical protein
MSDFTEFFGKICLFTCVKDHCNFAFYNDSRHCYEHLFGYQRNFFAIVMGTCKRGGRDIIKCITHHGKLLLYVGTDYIHITVIA